MRFHNKVMFEIEFKGAYSFTKLKRGKGVKARKGNSNYKTEVWKKVVNSEWQAISGVSQVTQW